MPISVVLVLFVGSPRHTEYDLAASYGLKVLEEFQCVLSAQVLDNFEAYDDIHALLYEWKCTNVAHEQSIVVSLPAALLQIRNEDAPPDDPGPCSLLDGPRWPPLTAANIEDGAGFPIELP